MTLIAELINHFVNGIANNLKNIKMAKMMKKAADGYTNYGSKASTPSPVTDYAGKTSKPDSYTQYKKGGVIKKKAEKGSSFGMLSVKAGVDKNPNATFADKIAGAKKMAKSGTKMMKLGGAAAKQAAIAIAMKKAGKTPKKMQYGGEAASMVPTMKKGGMKKKYKNGGMLAAPTKGGVSMQLGSYTRQIGKNYTGKNVVNKGAKAKMGKSMGKCKNGC